MMKNPKTDRTSAELRQLCDALLTNQYDRRAPDLSVREFQNLYSILTEMLEHHVPKMSIVNLGKQVVVQFSDVSPQRFLVNARKDFSEQDFAFVTNKEWFGPYEKIQSFPSFVVAETRLNFWKLLPVFIVSVLLLSIARDDSLYELMSSLLIQIETVFLSIFLIFAVTQNQTLQSDEQLFGSGLLHKYYADDRNLTTLAILTIALTLINIILSHLARVYNFSWSFGPIALDRHPLLAITSAFAISLLFDIFLTVVGYYFERTKSVLDRNMVDEILHKEFEGNYYPKDRTSKPRN